MAKPEPLPQINPVPGYVGRKVFPAWSWVMDEDKQSSRSVVGMGQKILWANCESLIICADTGNGKSTCSQNLVRANMGLIPDFLGFVARQFSNILYIAADRPEQIRASLKRMMKLEDQVAWETKLHIHDGPLDFVLNEQPRMLVEFVKKLADELDRPCFDAVVVDSLKDVVSEMDDNTAGIQINHAFQALCYVGIQLVIDVHPRKMNTGRDKDRPPILDDVGGNKNIIAGAGSVVYLGAPDVEDYGELYHLKSPAQRIDNLCIRSDKATGDLSYRALGLV